MPRDERYPNPLINMSPDGLPGFLVVLVVFLGFVSLFVSREVGTILLWAVIAIALVACGIGVYRMFARSRGES
jgi:hypothetical protein